MRRPPVGAREPFRVGIREAPPVLTQPPLVGEAAQSESEATLGSLLAARPAGTLSFFDGGRAPALYVVRAPFRKRERPGLTAEAPPAIRYLRMPSWSMRALYRA
jgi:hypothetical protein